MEERKPIAVVTGGAHRLGRIFAVALAKLGYAILLHYHQAHKEAQQTVSELEAFGTNVILAQADLTEREEIVNLFAKLDAMPYQLEVLVNSAAVMKRAHALTLSYSDWDSTLDLNLRAPFLCSQEAARRMDTGLIVNITDVGAQKVWSGFPAYAVSKAALESLTRILARSLAPAIRVNAIAPGLVLSEDNMPAQDWDRLVARVPMNRQAQPKDIASALEFLLTNDYVTGQIIVVDGGYSLVGGD